MSRTAITFPSWLILTHRTLGVTLCLLFLVWFVSGIVLMYCPFPAVEPENRLARAAFAAGFTSRRGTPSLPPVPPRSTNNIILKGGTSLSKGWNLIPQFSEDTDIFLDPLAFQPPLGGEL